MIELSTTQKELLHEVLGKKTFLEGPAGSGKSTIGLAYLEMLLQQGIPGGDILILVPQRSLGFNYQSLQETFPELNGTPPTVQTFGGIAQRMIRLFWPAIAEKAGFQKKNTPPGFLTLESAQYYLAKVCEPYFNKGYFETVHAEKPRILSQILDNLNKSAVVGFPYTSFAERLKEAWNQKPDHFHAFDEAQECANAFREFCYANNLLDYSLQFEVFHKVLWHSHLCRNLLKQTYRHLIYENCEEDVPIVHDIVLEWLLEFETSLILFDQNAGLRTFLGADPISAYRLKDGSDQHFTLDGSWVTSSGIQDLEQVLMKALDRQKIELQNEDFFKSLHFTHQMYYPKMMDSVAEKIEELLSNPEILPGDIAILAPFVSDALRFQIQNRLEKRNIPVITNRPSRSLREELTTQVMLTLAKIAHPHWNMESSRFDMRTALVSVLGSIDPMRADLMARVLYQPKGEPVLADTENINLDMLERFTFSASDQYAHLRSWILDYQDHPDELDVFWARLFGEVLSQPGFGYHQEFGAASVTARLIESYQKFRRVTSGNTDEQSIPVAAEYIQMVENGVIAALYLDTRETQKPDAVFLAPAHTFLMRNQVVKIQFWLDIGSLGWWQRLMQPLTQPYILSRQWQTGQKWTDMNEYQTNQANLIRLTSGLLRRCAQQLYVYTSGYNERGDEERGPLLQAMQRILRIRQQWETEDYV